MIVQNNDSNMRDEQNNTTSIFRDTGPYSARNSSKGALIGETGKVVEKLRLGMSLGALRTLALDGVILSQRARSTRERIWDAIHYMYLSQPEWGLQDLQVAYGYSPHSNEFVSLLYLHYALSDHLTYDFVTKILWGRRNDAQQIVSPQEILFLLDQAAETQPQIQRWAESTRRKLSTSILTALRDFGVLEGGQKKRLARPLLPLSTAEHILHILTAEGKRGAEVLSNSTWRLFFCSENDVAGHLGRLAQERRIQFERVGDTVVLHTPEEWSMGQ
ncbi:MAG: DUF1819 family protein [Chloroflexia bacterium]|nr:DUF1819 family protein [Chloroflexia bacterium]